MQSYRTYAIYEYIESATSNLILFLDLWFFWSQYLYASVLLWRLVLLFFQAFSVGSLEGSLLEALVDRKSVLVDPRLVWQLLFSQPLLNLPIFKSFYYH